MSCVVHGCANKACKKIPGVSFHAFPKNETLKAEWLKAVRRENWNPSKYCTICSEHFQESDFDRASPYRVYLKPHSVPSIFKALPEYLQKNMTIGKPVYGVETDRNQLCGDVTNNASVSQLVNYSSDVFAPIESWIDKKCDVKRKMHRILTGKGPEKELTSLEERIYQLIKKAGTVDDLDVEESSLTLDESASPASPAIPASGSSLTTTVQTNDLIIKQEPIVTKEFIVPDTPSHPPENHLPQESITPSLQISQAKDDGLQSLGMKEPVLPTNGSFYIIATQATSLPIKQEQTEEFLVQDPSENCLPQKSLPPPPCETPQANEDVLRSSNSSARTNPLVLDVQSLVPSIQSHPLEDDCSQLPTAQVKNDRLRFSNRKVRAKSVVLKTENAQRLVEGQIQMATALTRCADALAKQNELQERALEIKKRKVDVQERALEIEKQKADAFLEIFSIVKNKFC